MLHKGDKKPILQFKYQLYQGNINKAKKEWLFPVFIQIISYV